MRDIVLEINQRKIYNDIRSQIDVTEETTTTTDTTYEDYLVSKRINLVLAVGASIDVEIQTRNPATGVTWLAGDTDAQGSAYSSTSGWVKLTTVLLSSREAGNYGYGTYRITNNQSESMRTDALNAWYRYEKTEAKVRTDTNQITIQVRATDETSIAKYGRRVLPLNWPLGQTQQQMQTLVEAYLEKYKEPVPLLSPLHIQGSTDALIEQIFTRQISDRITVTNTELGLAGGEFFINKISANYAWDGLLECDWECEQARDTELASFFTLDTSELDGTDILGW
jgi:hypothetical protein